MDVDSFQVIKDGYQKPFGSIQTSSVLEAKGSRVMSLLKTTPKKPHHPNSDFQTGLRSTLLLNNINPRSLLSVAAGWTPWTPWTPGTPGFLGFLGPFKGTLHLHSRNHRPPGDLTVPDELSLASKAPQPELGYFGWYPCLGAGCSTRLDEHL